MTKGNGGANEHMCVCLQDQSAQIKKNQDQDQDRPALWSPSLFYGHVVAVPTVHLHAE